ncbi:hypothetical protein C8N40_1145 [Pontibacter mucosus]|uniref:Uncharacterized protein n=1 Tax=Pontibacter mucosus TaxID=1649266 RepID=A0A2T5Y7A1_9BACT|nr:hypothetical protein [Pontibacter mucosus]PTX12207.1 hypothetical protein C8N40_1145 [Pontibacter mucosus]
MRTILILVAAAVGLFSCSQEHKAGEAGHHHGHAVHTELALNDGERWQADEATNDNIAQLQQLMEEHLSQPDADEPEAVHELSRAMQLGFQEVFEECRMKGPEHDMLHVYLMPMLEDVKALESGKAEESLAARDRLAEQLEAYQTYFK